jgi:SAM-dependent methyltransferase
MRLLVAIASYGTGNDRHLARVVREYRSMSFSVDIVVLSNKVKDVSADVELSVGLPDRNPWSLPFAHKQLFADRLSDYELFLYSEDDILVTERNIRAFLRAVDALPKEEIPGFLRFEESSAGRNYPDFHGRFHWDTESVRRRGEYTLAYFTNEHAACYLLTSAQLKRAIDSGGYLVRPHKGNYDLPCSAATDPYTQCGFTKAICISHVDKFLVHHLSNKYVESGYGVGEAEFYRQIQKLVALDINGGGVASLFATETKLTDAWYSKDYYEPPLQRVASIIPPYVRTILSIGCGWGATEAWLAGKGYQVTAVPLDPVIPGGAAAAGVELVYGDFESAERELTGRQFDCLLLLNVLHLVECPVALLASMKRLLSTTSIVISLVPNMGRARRLWTKSSRELHSSDINYESSGAHYISHKVMQTWFSAVGTKAETAIDILPPDKRRLCTLTLGLGNSFLSSEFYYIAQLT